MAKDTIKPDEDELPGPISIDDTGDTGEGGKLRMIVGLLKKAFGVKDIAAMRLSLPASLMEPVPNLEYWSYLDRPDLFVGINESPDSFERLLAVLRFLFSKDIKFIHGKICKPYNSVLGEFFLAHWDVVPVSYPSDDRTQPPIQHLYLLNPKPEEKTSRPQTPSLGSSPPKSQRNSFQGKKNGKHPNPLLAANDRRAPSPTLSAVEQNLAAGLSDLSLATPSERSLAEGSSPARTSSSSSIPERVRVTFLTEQISHHPPISSFHYTVPSLGLSASGIDQIAARVSGTSVKIAPGEYNKGIHVRISEGNGKGERYRISHPTASVNGILTGKFYATVGESSVVSIEGGERWRVVLEYKDESWLGSPKFALEGVVHTYEEGEREECESWTRVKHVPPSKVIARIEGCWKNELRYKRTGDPDWTPLINLSNLAPIPKSVRPLSSQLPNESRKLWDGVTTNLLSKQYAEATRIKQGIEQKQRDLAAGRKRSGEEFKPVYFELDLESGAPALTREGVEMLEKEALAS